MLSDLLSIIAGVPWTIALTLTAFILGALVGIPLCAMRLSKLHVLRQTAALIVLTVRSVPPIVWLFFIFFGIGSSVISISPFFAAVIGLGLITATNMAEIYRGALTALHPGQVEAATVLNLTRVQQFKDVVAPQLVRLSIPATATFVIGLLKDSAVASTVGVSEIAFHSYSVSQQTFHGLSVYTSAALLYIALSLPVAWFSRWADAQLRSKVSR